MQSTLPDKPAVARIVLAVTTNQWHKSMSRRAKIEAMLADEPGDQFLRYSLAMEFEKEREHEASLSHLAALQRDATPYVPAFFMAAQQLARLERVEESRAVLRTGIDEARRQGDGHAAAEMSEFLAGLGRAES